MLSDLVGSSIKEVERELIVQTVLYLQRKPYSRSEAVEGIGSDPAL